MEVELEEAKWMQTHFDQLNLIEEKMLASLFQDQMYQRRMKKAFDKRIRPREFQEGDLALKKIMPTQKDPRGKWTPNYEGTYIIWKIMEGFWKDMGYQSFKIFFDHYKGVNRLEEDTRGFVGIGIGFLRIKAKEYWDFNGNY
ncbi:hypothetical protein CR513_54179, partial [Mucuna pruriens]